MRQLVESAALPLSGDMLRATVSIGGCLAKETDTLETALKRADAMMYQSKNAGRNCTSLDCL